METTFNLDAAVSSILHSIQTAVKVDRVVIDKQVQQVLENLGSAEIVNQIKTCLSPHMYKFLAYMNDNLEHFDLDCLEQETHVNDQGVYAGIVWESERFSIYVGSSYGSRGLSFRIHKQHRSEAYRRRWSGKNFYIAMEKPNSTTKFLRLVHFPAQTSTGIVLLAEAICCCLFGTYDTPFYRRARPSDLPIVDFGKGLNQSDPLRYFPPGSARFGDEAASFHRLKRLENCLQSGPMKVYCTKQRDEFRMSLFNINIVIPVAIGVAWQLRTDSVVDVKWEALPSRHPIPYVPMTGNSDPGQGVGIRISKTIDGTYHEYWLQRRHSRDIRKTIGVANTLYDLLTKAVVGKDYDWDENRAYPRTFIFCNRRKEHVGTTQPTSSSTTNRVQDIRVTLDKTQFKWNDPDRLPETRPQAHLRSTSSQGNDELEWVHYISTLECGLDTCLDDISYETESNQSDREDVVDNPYIGEPGWKAALEQERDDRECRIRLLTERIDIADYQDEEEELMWFSMEYGSESSSELGPWDEPDWGEG